MGHAFPFRLSALANVAPMELDLIFFIICYRHVAPTELK